MAHGTLNYYDVATNKIPTDNLFVQWNNNIKIELIRTYNQQLPTFLNMQIDNTMSKVKQLSYSQQYWSNFTKVDCREFL